jgi:hypothetical protein
MKRYTTFIILLAACACCAMPTAPSAKPSRGDSIVVRTDCSGYSVQCG